MEEWERQELRGLGMSFLHADSKGHHTQAQLSELTNYIST